MNKYIKLLVTILIMSMATLLAFVLNIMLLRVENILMLYLLGTIIVIIITKSSAYGLLSSIISVVFFNFFFTQPLMSLKIYDPNYVSALILFFIISIIAGRITSSMQKMLTISKEQEKNAQSMYHLNLKFLEINTIEEAIDCSIDVLSQISDVPVSFIEFEEHNNKKLLYEQYSTSYTKQYEVQVDDKVMRMLIFDHSFYQIKEEFVFYIEMIISDLELTLKRITAYNNASKNQIRIEKERLRNNLLRSISHDIKTPLTTILSGTSMILEDCEQMNNETKEILIQVNEEALWLNEMVENLLNITRLEDGKLQLKWNKEVIDDIVFDAAKRFSSRQPTHFLSTHLPNHVYMIEVDAKLIVQVLVNLIGNAFKHTPKNTHIDINVKIEDNEAIFEVVDDGLGIDERIINNVFEQYVNIQRAADSRRSGLGLSISKAIIEAHHGKIYAENIEPHGAKITFKIPLSKGVKNEKDNTNN